MRDLTVSENATVGSLAAFIEAVILQPTLYWKNARAQRLPFTINPKIIYRGTMASIFNEIQMMGVQFGATGLCQSVMRKWSRESTLSSNMSQFADVCAAFLGGVISTVSSSPIELVMIQQQRFGGSLLSTAQRIVQSRGYMSEGLMRGYQAGMVREGIYVVGMLGVTPSLQRILVEEYGLSRHVAGFYASMAGGLLAALPSHPFDIIKTCMQGDMAQEQYRSTLHTARRLYFEGGWRRFFHGCFWRTVNITATVWIVNECMGYFPGLIFPDIEEHKSCNAKNINTNNVS